MKKVGCQIYCPLGPGGASTPDGAKHADALGGSLSDAGSTPAASTIPPAVISSPGQGGRLGPFIVIEHSEHNSGFSW